jgi:hypothetical protein
MHKPIRRAKPMPRRTDSGKKEKARRIQRIGFLFELGVIDSAQKRNLRNAVKDPEKWGMFLSEINRKIQAIKKGKANAGIHLMKKNLLKDGDLAIMRKALNGKRLSEDEKTQLIELKRRIAGARKQGIII